MLVRRSFIAGAVSGLSLAALAQAQPRRRRSRESALLSYGADQRAISRRVATYADRTLNGAKPAEMPVEQPTRSELIVNTKTARALGLAIPQSFLVRVDESVDQ